MSFPRFAAALSCVAAVSCAMQSSRKVTPGEVIFGLRLCSPGRVRSRNLDSPSMSWPARSLKLARPYNDDPGNSGLLVSKAGHLLDVARRARALGFQVNTHAIGDRRHSQLDRRIRRGGCEAGGPIWRRAFSDCRAGGLRAHRSRWDHRLDAADARHIGHVLDRGSRRAGAHQREPTRGERC